MWFYWNAKQLCELFKHPILFTTWREFKRSSIKNNIFFKQKTANVVAPKYRFRCCCFNFVISTVFSNFFFDSQVFVTFVYWVLFYVQIHVLLNSFIFDLKHSKKKIRCINVLCVFCLLLLILKINQWNLNFSENDWFWVHFEMKFVFPISLHFDSILNDETEFAFCEQKQNVIWFTLNCSNPCFCMRVFACLWKLQKWEFFL